MGQPSQNLQQLPPNPTKHHGRHARSIGIGARASVPGEQRAGREFHPGGPGKFVSFSVPRPRTSVRSELMLAIPIPTRPASKSHSALGSTNASCKPLSRVLPLQRGAGMQALASPARQPKMSPVRSTRGCERFSRMTWICWRNSSPSFLGVRVHNGSRRPQSWAVILVSRLRRKRWIELYLLLALDSHDIRHHHLARRR